MTIYIFIFLIFNVSLLVSSEHCPWNPRDPSGFACSPSSTFRVNAQRNGRFDTFVPLSKPRMYKAVLHVTKGYHLNSRTAPSFTTDELTSVSSFETCLFNECLNIIHASGDSNWTYFAEDLRYYH